MPSYAKHLTLCARLSPLMLLIRLSGNSNFGNVAKSIVCLHHMRVYIFPASKYYLPIEPNNFLPHNVHQHSCTSLFNKVEAFFTPAKLNLISTALVE